MKGLTDQTDTTRFVNRIYNVLSHLSERLDEIKNVPSFSDLRETIINTIAKLELRIKILGEVYRIRDVNCSYAQCEYTINFLELTFSAICLPNNTHSAIALLEYISVADASVKQSARMASLLSASSIKTADPQVQLYDEATLTDLRTLLEESFVTV